MIATACAHTGQGARLGTEERIFDTRLQSARIVVIMDSLIPVGLDNAVCGLQQFRPIGTLSAAIAIVSIGDRFGMAPPAQPFRIGHRFRHRDHCERRKAEISQHRATVHGSIFLEADSGCEAHGHSRSRAMECLASLANAMTVLTQHALTFGQCSR